MSKPLKILSWNVHYPDFARDSSYVVTQLKNADRFDVICLQEYVDGADDKLKLWLQANDYDISYIPFAYRGKLSQGVMTATRKALKASTQAVTLREDGPMPLRPFPNIRGLLDARVQLGDQTISILNTHLTYSRIHTRDMRRREFKELQDYLTAVSAKRPLVLCGDFNFLGNDSRRNYLTTHYQSFTGTNTKTWEHQRKLSPMRANLDYFFWDDKLLSLEAEVGELNVSDHRPLTAKVSKA